MEKKTHWENIYHTKDFAQVSWFKPHLTASLEIILGLAIQKGDPVIDVGGGASTLVDDLLEAGFQDITILDISKKALEVSQKRLGQQSKKIKWIEGDVTQTELPEQHYEIWHDRAVFHFLTNSEDRRRYIDALEYSLKAGGHVIVATFSLKGPERCSGLEIVRYSPESLQLELGKRFKLIKSFAESHKTPFGTTQEFMYGHFQKV